MLRDSNNLGAVDEAKKNLLAVGTSNQIIAFVIRSLGFRAHTKFPADFDVVLACEASILHLTPFLADAKTCLKEGNVANIMQASHDAWKGIFRERMSDFADTALVMDILKLEDVLDGITAIAGLQMKASKQADDARKSPTSIKTGCAARAVKIRETKKLGQIKRKLSELTSEGDCTASSILEKLEEDKPLEDGDGAEGGRKAARKRGIRRTRKRKGRQPRTAPYRRQKGDELRLIKKREIVPPYIVQQLFLFFCASKLSNTPFQC